MRRCVTPRRSAPQGRRHRPLPCSNRRRSLSGNKALLAGYGRALADNGNFQQALDVLGRAHTPDDPDWRILSVQGTALDQLGRFEEARQYYASALKIAPEEPSVLSNLGLSYVLSKDLPKAEETLRRANTRAPTDPRVRANLALVVGLQGHMPEAETMAKADLAPEEAPPMSPIQAAIVAERKRECAGGGVEKLPIAPAGRCRLSARTNRRPSSSPV